MSLPLPVSISVGLFNEKISVYTVDEVILNGYRQQTNRVDFTITGCIQTDRRQVIKLNAEGALADGSISLRTRWVLPAYNSTDRGVKHTQTYVVYGDETWKLTRLTNWAYKTQKVNIYYLTKYQALENLTDDLI